LEKEALLAEAESGGIAVVGVSEKVLEDRG